MMSVFFRTRLAIATMLCAFGLSLTAAAQEKEVTNSIGMKLKLIPAGTFMMGSPPDEKGSEDDERQHQVTISQPYYMGVYEVTQAQYQKVMGKNPSHFQGDAVAIKIPAKKHPQTGRTIEEAKIVPVDTSNYPVELVSWEDAVAFCEKLSSLPSERAAGRVYRLPTEAEWEHACRAGSKTAYSFGNDASSLGEYAWIIDNSGGKTHAVGQKQPNAWGLYDMHGNVWEWCMDRYGDYPRGSVTDPVGASSGSRRVARGGSWVNTAEDCRSSDRNGGIPSSRINVSGFRVTCVPSGQ